MSFRVARTIPYFLLLLLLTLSALAQTAVQKKVVPGKITTTAHPTVRVTGTVSNSVRTTLTNSLPKALRVSTDLGRVASSTTAQQVLIVLQPTLDQKRELRRVIDEQQDQNAAGYHQWLTPDQYGQYFGVADEDIAKISDWLSSQGLAVEEVSKGKQVIRISGTIAQIESAFQTELHSFDVNGETHVSNSKAISVPVALSSVIGGVTLNNFFRKGQTVRPRTLASIKADPLYTSGSTSYVTPGDFAVLYNTKPLLQAGIDGTGTSIAVIGRTDLNIADVQTYRQMFGLPSNDPIFIHAGPDNGEVPGDDGESYLDVEVSGGVAPGAKVYFVIGTPTYLVDGITNSLLYTVDNNLADIVSISYGMCEAREGTYGVFNEQIAQQAAAQGMSVFVSSGDNGPAACDSANNSYEVYGYAVSVDASNAYTIAVGGSEFYEGSNFSTYWGTMDPKTFASALGYAPETAWNEARGADKTASTSLSGLWSASGGISAYFLQPSWQRGPGVPTTDPTLTGGLWVDTYAITNAGAGYTAAPTVTFTGGGCTSAARATASISGGSLAALSFSNLGIGCTSAPTVTISAAPSGGTTATVTATVGPMQTPLPVITGVPHRYLPDVSLNAASGHDGTLFCGSGNCQLSSTGTLLSAGIVGGTSVAAPEMAGIQALVNQYNGGRQGMPGYIYYALAAAQDPVLCDSALPPLATSGCVYQDITLGNNLVCGTSTCSATTGTKIGFQAGTGYDLATGLGSVNAANMATKWKNVVFNSTSTTLGLSQSSTAQGSAAVLSGKVAVGSGSGTPTGDVAFIVSKGSFTNSVDAYGSGNLNLPTPVATLDASGNYTRTLTNLPGGTYTVTARYAGDNNFASSLSTPVTVTVDKGNSAVTITPQYFDDTATCGLYSVTSYNYGQYAWIPAVVTATSGQGVPTGTVTYTVDGVAVATQTIDTQGNGYLAAGTVSTSSCIAGYMYANSPTLTAGTHVIGASYSGDGTFAPATATPVTIIVNKLTVTPALTISSPYTTSGGTVPMLANFTTTALNGYSATSYGPTGNVTFTDTTTNTVLGTVAVNSTVVFNGTTYTFGANAQLTTTAITAAGAHSITASYSGDTNFNAATSAAATVTVGTGTATTVTVTSSANPTALNGRPTLTATVGLTAAGTAPTSGSVAFYDSYSGPSVLLGTATVGAAHTATYRPATTTTFWAGNHPITAVYSGTSTYAGSASTAFTQTVNQGTTTLVVTAKTAGTYGDQFGFNAKLSPSVTYTAYAPNQGVVQFWTGSTLLGTGVPATSDGTGIFYASLQKKLDAGTYSVTATYSDVNYTTPTASAAITVVVNQASQAISFGLASPVTYPVAPIALSATGGGSGNAVTFSVLSGPGSIVGNLLTVTGAGDIVVAANQAGDTNYLAAPPVTQTLHVNKGSQAISFSLASPVTYGTSAIQLSATGGGSTSPVTYSVISGPGSIAGNMLAVNGAGAIVVAADQAGDNNYNAAPQVLQTLTVDKAAQTLNFAVASPVTYGVAPITLSATGGGSGMPITFAVASGPGYLTGSVLTVTGAGSIVINANQAGNVNYLAASQATQTLVVNKATPTIKLTTSAAAVFYSNPITLTATLTGPTAPTGTVSFLDGSTQIGTGTLASGITTLTTSTLSAAVHTLTIAYAGDANFLPVSSAALTETVQEFSTAAPAGNSSLTQTALPGTVATYNLTFTPTVGTTFPTALTFTASGLPKGATATFSPTTIAAGSGVTTVVVSVNVPAVGAAAQSKTDDLASVKPSHNWAYLSLALLLLPFSGRIRKTGRKLGRLLPVLILLLGGAALLTMSGCGSLNSGLFGQPAATYTIQITATSGNLSHSTSLTLNVQ